MTYVEYYNAAEVLLWLMLATALAIVARRRPEARGRLLTAVVLLVLFALSDAAEFKTGAWWRPWWLLLWKGICLLGLLVLAPSCYRAARAHRS